jgi:hypothetical protein
MKQFTKPAAYPTGRSLVFLLGNIRCCVWLFRY